MKKHMWVWVALGVWLVFLGGLSTVSSIIGGVTGGVTAAKT